MTLPITITQRRGSRQRTHRRYRREYLVEVDRDRFERIAASLGFFREEFLESLARAERDIREGRVRKLRSPRDLRV